MNTNLHHFESKDHRVIIYVCVLSDHMCVFKHAQRDLLTYAHGNGYVTAGSPENLKWMKLQLENITKSKQRS